jgi:hypothetical protein
MSHGPSRRAFSETTPFSHGSRKWAFGSVLLAVLFLAPFLVVDPEEPQYWTDVVVLWCVLGVAFAFMFRTLQGRVRVVVDDRRLLVDVRPGGERRVYPREVILGVEEGYYSPLSDNPGWGSSRDVQPVQALEMGHGGGVWVSLDGAPRLFLPSARPRDLAAAIEALLAGRTTMQ